MIKLNNNSKRVRSFINNCILVNNMLNIKLFSDADKVDSDIISDRINFMLFNIYKQLKSGNKINEFKLGKIGVCIVDKDEFMAISKVYSVDVNDDDFIINNDDNVLKNKCVKLFFNFDNFFGVNDFVFK
jgi:hypothetical protein